MANERKTRYWAGLLYPENNEDIEIIIENMHVPVILSPLHDKDVWTELDQAKNPDHIAGELKPPHWHILFLFDGPVRASQAMSCLSQFTNPTHHVEAVSSLPAYARYMLHLDNPNKYQYNRADMSFYNGATVTLDRPLTPDEEDKLITEILAWIRDFNIVEYSDLVLYATDIKPAWNRVVRTKTVFWRGYFDSFRYKKSAANQKSNN